MRDLSLPHSGASLTIDGHSLSIEQVVAVARHRHRVTVAHSTLVGVARCRGLVDVLLEKNEKVYGLTTGFGVLRNVRIKPEQTRELQEHLIRSHSAGVGQPFAEDVVRAAILLRANTLCRGNSGVRVDIIHRLIAMLNDDVFPFVPSKGSVGASGDLAPLSHLALVLMGDTGGRYFPRARRPKIDGVPSEEIISGCSERDFEAMPGADGSSRLTTIEREEGWTTFAPIRLEAKEGLALNNGTPFMTGIGCLAVWDAFLVLRYAELAAAMSLEANRGVRYAYSRAIHEARPQEYQWEAAQRVIGYCDGSQIIDFYLNTGELHRAENALEEALDALSSVARDARSERGQPIAAVEDAVLELERLSTAVKALVPVGVDDLADPSWVTEYIARPARDQIKKLNEHLLLVRNGALGLVIALQDQTIPRSTATGSTEAAESALLSALDHLKKAVPSSPLVQDDYSFRCYPQVVGGAHRALAHVCGIVEVEINSATDNPLLFPIEPEGGYAALGVSADASPEDHKAAYTHWLTDDAHPERVGLAIAAVVGGGNFHGQPIATAMDYLAISVAEIASIAERRIAHLVDENHSSGLPPFLVQRSGLNSGFMIPQYTAAALVSENKVLCHPASVDSIPTCADSEDHVSMGTIAARKCASVIEHVRTVVAIELLAACQGLVFRRPLQPGLAIRRAVLAIREAGVQPYDDDRVMFTDISRVDLLLRDRALFERCTKAS